MTPSFLDSGFRSSGATPLQAALIHCHCEGSMTAAISEFSHNNGFEIAASYRTREDSLECSL